MNKQTIKIFPLALLLMAVTSTSRAQNSDVWKGTWATAVEWTGKGDMPKESLSNRSCRQIVHVSFGGKELRLKLSNEQSKTPVEISSVYIADTDVPSNWGISAKSVKYLKFGGKKSVTIALRQGHLFRQPEICPEGRSATHRHHRLRAADSRERHLAQRFPHHLLYSKQCKRQGRETRRCLLRLAGEGRPLV